MQTPQKTSRRVKWLLVASLILNLLFVGIFAGAAYRYGGGHGPRGPQMQGYGVPYTQALPRAERRALHRALRSEGVLPSRKMRQEMYQNVLQGLRAEPFEVDALSEVMRQQGQNVQSVQSAAQAGWLKVVAGMSATDRLAYADALEQRLKHGHRRGGRKERK